MESVLNWGIEAVLWFQQFSPGLDWPFRILTFLGDEGFYLLFIPLIYWCLDRETGIRLTVIFLFSAYINTTAKILAGQPRPFQYDLRVKPLVHADGYGLPSGHTQGAVVLWGYLASRYGHKWLWISAGILMVLIPMSRVYLGVHFPTDLLGGYLLGALLLVGYLVLEPRVSGLLSRIGPARQLALITTVCGMLIIASPGGAKSGISTGSALMGGLIGLVFERRIVRFETAGAWGTRLLRYFMGLLIVAAVYAGFKVVFAAFEPSNVYRFIRYFLVGLATTFLAPLVFVRLGLSPRSNPEK